MLVLSRKTNERIIIGDEIEVIVLDVREGNVKLGIKAPREISVHREEVYAEIMSENVRAQDKNKDSLASAALALKGSIPKKVKRTMVDENTRAVASKTGSKDSIASIGKSIYKKKAKK